MKKLAARKLHDAPVLRFPAHRSNVARRNFSDRGGTPADFTIRPQQELCTVRGQLFSLPVRMRYYQAVENSGRYQPDRREWHSAGHARAERASYRAFI